MLHIEDTYKVFFKMQWCVSLERLIIYVINVFHFVTSWQIDGKTMETVTDFSLGAPKSLQMVTTAMKLKDTCSLEEKLLPTKTEY